MSICFFIKKQPYVCYNKSGYYSSSPKIGALPEYGTLSDGVVFVDFFFFKTRYMKIRSDIGKTHMPRPV